MNEWNAHAYVITTTKTKQDTCLAVESLSACLVYIMDKFYA